MKYNFYPFCGGKDYELALVNDNKAVIKINITYSRAPYNGYIVFPAKDIPKDWWGNYNAGALQYLDIHGGITFCECELNNIEKNKKRRGKTQKQVASIKVKKNDYMDKFKKQQKVRLEENQKTAELEDSYVVFGFDCAHSGDENNNYLKNPEHIMKLVEKMEQQLIDYAGIYEKWKKMNRKDQIKAIDKIVGERNGNQLGFGAMIDMLAGGKVFKGED